MGKILMWVVVVGIAYVAWQLLVVSKRRVDRSRGEGEGDGGAADGSGSGDGARGGRGNGHAGRLRAPEAMMQCAVCGVHLPGSEAFFARGRVFCSAEHRDQDEAARRAPGDRAER